MHLLVCSGTSTCNIVSHSAWLNQNLKSDELVSVTGQQHHSERPSHSRSFVHGLQVYIPQLKSEEAFTWVVAFIRNTEHTELNIQYGA